jgi:murein DD-endopeptidase MepM/ murein hydrolase activator NlpD
MKKLAGFLAACLLVLIGSQSSVIAQTFTKGDIVEVYNTGGIGLRVRNAPCGDRIGNEPDGSIGIILEGPIYCVLEGTGYYWWRIRWSDGMQGWSAQNWLRKLSLPWITSASPSPSTIPPGGTVTLTYNVTNLDKEIGGAIAPLLGASIQLSGGGPVLSDPANDRKATIRPGSSSVSRPFVVPATAAPGTYDLLVSLVADVNNNGRIDPEDRAWDLKIFPRVLQVRVTCTYSIFPTSQSFSSAGGSGSVNVTAPSGCPWTATSNASWITITSGSSGNGNGTVNYSVASNPSTTPRTGTMTIAGQTFTVTQDGAPPPPSTGTIQVNATLNGATWSGSVSYRLTGPQTIDGTTVPATFSNRPTGSYTLNYQSGGPSGATLTSITPSATQTLSAGGTITFNLNFSTTPSQNPILEVTPSSLNFGNVTVGQCSTNQSFTVRNAGGGTLTGTAATSAPFNIVSGGSFSLGANQSAQVTVRFCPTVAGQANGTVSFSSNGGNISRSVSGIGVRVEDGHPIASLPFAWPLRPDNRRSLGQDYAQYNGYPNRPNHYHTGLDIGGSAGTMVFAVAVGTVVAVCPDGVQGGCVFNGQRFSENSTNHDMDGVVILRHVLSDGRVIYSLYAHLGSVGQFWPGQVVWPNTSLGTIKSDHLHFEIKERPVLHNPEEKERSCIDPRSGQRSARCWGYVLSHPKEYGYHDPILYFHDVTKFDSPRRVRITEDGVYLLVGPGGSDVSGTEYRHFNSVHAGQEYEALARSPGTSTPHCPEGWYQIRPTDGSRFNDTSRPGSSIPDGWVCARFISDTFFTLTVNKTGSGQGTVTSSPSGIDCGPTCSADFTSGAVVTLTATPATGSTFAGWSGACSGTGTCTVTMDTDKTVTATFTSTVRPPAAPNQLRVRAVSSRRVDLSWNDRSNNEDGFRIYRNGSLIATVGANTTSYSDTTVRPRTSYCYQVAAYNAAGEARSSRVCKTTPQSFQLGTLMVAGILIGTAPNGIEFAIDGQGVSSAQVEVFDLKGRKVFDSGEVQDNTFTWNLQNNAGQRLANGVYLYVVRVRGFKGEVYVSEVRKLVIVR